ncbi:MAG: GNAT family N-acetyltransferase [Promethearchaeota archaeon]
MILLTPETLDDVSNLLDEYGQFIQEQLGIPSFPVKERFKTFLKERNDRIFAFYDNNHVPIGIARTSTEKGNPDEVYIMEFYCSEKGKDKGSLEINLFDAVFNQLKDNHTIIRVAGMPLSSDLRNHITSRNFTRFDRWKMSIDKSTVQSLSKLNLPLNYAFARWNDEYTEPIIEVITNYNDQNVDNILFPYFKTVDTVKAFIEDLTKNRWGKFKTNLTSILTHNGELIGVCFLTVLDNGKGYLPDIGILKTYQGKGLGKTLLIHSLKYYMEVQDSNEIELDVTLKNTVALNLYKSLGFRFKREYTVFVWNENDPT